jgi:predicted transcriptional regulator
MDAINHDELVQLTADIVSAYVSNNKVTAGELGRLIGDVHTALGRTPNPRMEPEPQPRQPAVPIRRSVTPDYIVSLEDGRKFKSLKRHLMNAYNMTPEEYRAKWGLPRDYPMVAPNYAKARSELAKTIGLGRKAAAPKAQGSGSKRGRGARAAKG